MVFLPGYACEASWQAAIHATFTSFQDHYIIAVNPRGYGGSTKNEPIYSHDENAQDIKLFLDTIGVNKTMVIGYSTGGAIALSMAIRYPETVIASFLLDSVPLDGSRQNFDKEGVPIDKPLLTYKEAENILLFYEQIGTHSESIDNFYAILRLSVKKGLPPKDDPIIRAWHKGAVNQTSRLESQIANAWFNVTPIANERTGPSLALKELRVPVIVIHGRKDTVVNRDRVKAITASAMKWAENGLISYYEHPGGHYPFFECPDEYQALYRRALEEQVLSRAKEAS